MSDYLDQYDTGHPEFGVRKHILYAASERLKGIEDAIREGIPYGGPSIGTRVWRDWYADEVARAKAAFAAVSSWEAS